MKIKSLEELKKIRENAKDKVSLREKGESKEPMTEILVGMATCGIAAGARDVMQALQQGIKEKDLSNVKLVQVGCMGYCHSEPTVQVNVPGQEPVIYGNVDEKVAMKILDEHVQGGRFIDHHILIKTFSKKN